MNASDPGRMMRQFSGVLHAIDHRFGRARGPRRVLVELRTPVYRAVLGPIYEALIEDRQVRVCFTSEHPDLIRPLVDGPVLTHAEAEWKRFDLYLNADPWAAARLRRCAGRLNFFHGVAGKYDLDRPAGLPMGFEYYDRVAFVNRDRMHRYLSSGIVRADQARLIGYPKLDALAGGRLDGAAVCERLGLRRTVPTILYAPTYSIESSLHVAGEAIVTALSTAGFNVIVKLHDRSLDRDPRYTGGVDWRVRMRALERPGHVVYVEEADLTPFLAAADALVTDHSSAGFEFLVLDRPLIVFDAPRLAEAARINPEKIALLRSAAAVVRDVRDLAGLVAAELRTPGRRSNRRRQVASDMFFDAGNATARSRALAYELLDAGSYVPADDLRTAQPSIRSLR